MTRYFAAQKDRISALLGERLGELSARLDDSGPLAAETIRILLEYARRGKMLRGGLVRLGYELRKPLGSGGAGDRAAVDEAGAAMELFQSGLLVHDDIMDRDEVRRGAPTMHVVFRERAAGRGLVDPARAGEALAICAGDMAFFLGNALLSSLSVADERRLRILALCSFELARVGAAQMSDVENGLDPGEVGERSILSVYRCKTGRYTFSLPLAAGAILADADDGFIARLERAGELCGILFQLKDDELGLFADAAKLGKPLGSDIRENKKTLLRADLLAAAPEPDRARLLAMFGDPAAGAAELEYVRKLALELGVRRRNVERMEKYAAMARAELDSLPGANPAALEIFRGLLEYSLHRES